MILLEYQAKEWIRKAGIAVPEGKLARTPEQAEAACMEMGAIAVKAQVPIGGRGKAGGIAIVDDPKSAHREAERILGMQVHGHPVPAVWCEPALSVEQELYLGITLDRSRRCLALIFSPAGGMEIEQVAEEQPEKLGTLWPDPFRGPQPFAVRQMMLPLLLADEKLAPRAGQIAGQVASIAVALFRLANDLDCITCEINPLVITKDGVFVAADAKIEIDDNAAFRHKDVAATVEEEQTGGDQLEAEAKRRKLTYVHLDGGYVGCIGNGAGLVMNTLDLVKRSGGEPANFLDIGGGAKAEVVLNAMEMVLLDPQVKGLFINIFGGITRGDEVARGIITAREKLNIKVPLVVRMTGTREEEGRKLLEEAGITPAVGATEAAQKIVELTKGTASQQKG